ncbi:MAG: carboxylesterase family protein [Pseudomonadota bacterium]|nr:carboxylesterase family protein [Pseudomonadota bacterium]
MRIVSMPALFAASLTLALSGCGGGDSDSHIVATDKGAVQGTNSNGALRFLGIPYAAPPVGPLRWQAPAAAAAWTNVRDGSVFGPHCAQVGGSFGTASSAEDCLYLNVFTPTSGPGPFPVMVWIHGGALVSGESDDYDPSALVANGVAVVTLNYRLGPLGFLSHAALSAEAGGASGNYGLMDQQAALRWVKTNIAAFGGDPANVTVFGESAGGLSTFSQIVSPLAAGLFQKAIVESGSYNLTPPTLATAQTWGANFATGAGCTDQSAACLRALPVATVLANAAALQVSGSTAPTVDGKVLTKTLVDAFASGSFNKVAVIAGTNQHEYSLLSAVTIDVALGHPVTAAMYPAEVNGIFGASLGGAVQALYPLSSALTPAQTLDDALTDGVFTCNSRKAAGLIAAAGSTVYAYEFADPNAPMVFKIPPRPEGYGAYHAAEIQYVFPGTYVVYFGAPFTAAQSTLSSQMVGYWTQFAKTGNPNAAGTSTWPAYTAASDTYLTLAPGAVATTNQVSAQHNCSTFWTPGI